MVTFAWQSYALAQDTKPPPATPAPPALPAAEAALVAPVNATPAGPVDYYWKARRDAALHSQWNILVDLQMVALDESKALDLIPDLLSSEPAKVNAAWEKLQAMIKSKEAILLGWPMVRAVDGGRSVSETITEKRYPTEFQDPPPIKPGEAPPTPALSEKAITQNATPTAFETRNLGATLEAEVAVLDDGKRIHLNIVPQRVELLEMEKFPSAITNGKAIVETPQPLFATSKTTEEFTVQNGQRQLVGVHKLSKPAGYIELHFIRAVASKAE
jgi:hypothetical protein